MQMTNTSVLTRRVVIDGTHRTLPYEIGWAREAIFFVQTEGSHPALALQPEVSPDGITWIPRGAPVLLGEAEGIAEIPLTVFGNWLRLTVSGATADGTARLLIHLNEKG